MAKPRLELGVVSSGEEARTSAQFLDLLLSRGLKRGEDFTVVDRTEEFRTRNGFPILYPSLCVETIGPVGGDGDNKHLISSRYSWFNSAESINREVDNYVQTQAA